ncbi:protein kinase domain-containing protein, partial [Nocardia abscessus]|uniref:protein kinase domain-containing protein n=1 Tax=Nocardia abscessus TaxID=120957 RepID=UPI002456D4AA
MSSPRTDAVVRFAADWQRSLHSDRLPPQIRDYVPDGTQVRLAVLVDLIRVDLRRRWEREGLGKRIAEYREEFPEVAGSPELLDLVCEEFLARRGRGPLPTEHFLAEYPDLTDAIRERLADFAAEDADEAGESSDALAALADLAPGLRIDDFDLLTDLGAGLLGRVFLARQRSMQRLVAVRFSAGRAGAPHTMAQLDHAHIVRVFDQRVLSADAARTLTVAGAPANGRPTADAESTIAVPRPTIAEPFEPDATVAAPPPGRTASRPDDDATVAAPRLPGTERADSAAERRSTADDATVAEAQLRDTERRPAADGATVAQPHLRDTERADVTISRRSTADDATVAAATPAARTRESSDDTTVTSPYRARRPRRDGAPVPDHEAGPSAESGNGTAVLDDPDATRADSIAPDATRPGPRQYAAASTGKQPPAPEAPVAPLPRLVYMQYLPGGTAVGVLDQRRRGPVTDGGALLLRAVDTAMEDKGEIRPSDSSVRAEIARLSWPETVAWVGRRLADALEYAEHHGVLHHDIKPANVLFTAEGIPKLADFALGEAAARIPAPRDPGPTDALVYRSPEQLAHYLDPGAPAPGHASDVYSLGVLLWEMLTGASPFDDPPPTEEGSVTETYARMLAVGAGGGPRPPGASPPRRPPPPPAPA